MAEPPPGRSVRIAVEGCCHGDLDQIYATITSLNAQAAATNSPPIALLLICGDFQAVRNEADLACLACPPKYRELKGFHRYYSGAAVAPVLTIFVGGNHEASNHLWELAHGGWVAPNIYYLGLAGVVTVSGLRIAGLSGIFDARDFTSPRVGPPPYSPSALRSAYHLREADIHRLTRLTGPVDIFLSHDWPAGIVAHGDGGALVRRKRFLASDIDSGSLGSPPGAHLLRHLRPRFWFAAHLHTKFAAVVPHDGEGDGNGGGGGSVTRFLALDKCLPGRDFLQVVDVPVRHDAAVADASSAPPPPATNLAYDPQWVAVMVATHDLMAPGVRLPRLAPVGPPAEAEVAAAAAALKAASDDGSLAIPHNFVVTAPAAGTPGAPTAPPQAGIRSPQTERLLGALGLAWNLDYPGGGGGGGGPPLPPPPPGLPPPGAWAAPMFVPPSVAAAAAANPEEIDI